VSADVVFALDFNFGLFTAVSDLSPHERAAASDLCMRINMLYITVFTLLLFHCDNDL
jgi:hypothetical protein